MMCGLQDDTTSSSDLPIMQAQVPPELQGPLNPLNPEIAMRDAHMVIMPKQNSKDHAKVRLQLAARTPLRLRLYI